jgi:hypothetical protein
MGDVDVWDIQHKVLLPVRVMWRRTKIYVHLVIDREVMGDVDVWEMPHKVLLPVRVMWRRKKIRTRTGRMRRWRKVWMRG